MEEQKEENKTKTFEDDEVLKPFELSLIVKREEFVKPRTIEILAVMYNKFGKPELKFLDEKGREARVTISKTNYNELLEKFGSTISQLKGNKITVRAEKTQVNRPNGEIVDGYLLKIL